MRRLLDFQNRRVSIPSDAHVEVSTGSGSCIKPVTINQLPYALTSKGINWKSFRSLVCGGNPHSRCQRGLVFQTKDVTGSLCSRIRQHPDNKKANDANVSGPQFFGEHGYSFPHTTLLMSAFVSEQLKITGSSIMLNGILFIDLLSPGFLGFLTMAARYMLWVHRLLVRFMVRLCLISSLEIAIRMSCYFSRDKE